MIPYAVGMDIACRMKLSLLDMPVSAIRGEEGRLRNVLQEATSFGVDWGFSPNRRAIRTERNQPLPPILRPHCILLSPHQ